MGGRGGGEERGRGGRRECGYVVSFQGNVCPRKQSNTARRHSGDVLCTSHFV